MSQLTTNRQGGRQGGFSLLEALLAAALVLVITLGVMPLFTTSIIQNVAGKESTVSSNYSRSTAEEMIALPLDRELLRPPVSQTTREVCQDYEEGVGWDYVICGAPLLGEPKWTRELNVQQYSIRDIYDADTSNGVPTFTNPITGLRKHGRTARLVRPCPRGHGRHGRPASSEQSARQGSPGRHRQLEGVLRWTTVSTTAT